MVSLNFAHFGKRGTLFVLYSIYFIIVTTNMISVDGKVAGLWCTRPGFDPMRVHFIFSTFSGKSSVSHGKGFIVYHPDLIPQITNKLDLRSSPLKDHHAPKSSMHTWSNKVNKGQELLDQEFPNHTPFLAKQPGPFFFFSIYLFYLA